jgi:hypothetical protein
MPRQPELYHWKQQLAWKVLYGNQQDPWHPHWCQLPGRLRGEVGPDWTVVVLSDRGQESARLFQGIVAVGWHPLMRVKAAGTFRPCGWMHWYTFKSFTPHIGARFAAVGLAYKTADEPLCCTLLACWGEGHAGGWSLLTDLAAGSASACWYAFRSWIEQGFKMIKGGALHWQDTRRSDPGRVGRLWLALAVTLLWLVVIGAAVASDQRKETIAAVGAGVQGQEAPAARRQRLFAVGRAEWLAAQLNGRPLPKGKLAPEPWPDTWHEVPTVTEQEFCSGQTYP